MGVELGGGLKSGEVEIQCGCATFVVVGGVSTTTYLPEDAGGYGLALTLYPVASPATKTTNTPFSAAFNFLRGQVRHRRSFTCQIDLLMTPNSTHVRSHDLLAHASSPQHTHEQVAGGELVSLTHCSLSKATSSCTIKDIIASPGQLRPSFESKTAGDDDAVPD